jgi:dihydrolipoamide dehydrogenase
VNPGYDVVIIGSGPGGYVAAIRAGQNGLKTAIVEKHSKLGGTCLHVGCIPTKSMLHSASLFDEAKHGAEFGVVAKDVTLDINAVLKRKDRVVNKNAQGVSFLMRKNKVDVYTGFGSLAGQGRVLVKAADGKETMLETKNVVLATGSVCRDFPAFPVDHRTILNSDDMFSLAEVPGSMIVLGAGAVGVEFASMYMRFGTKVTLIELMPAILPIEDQDISAELHKSLKRQGMNILVDTKVETVTKEGPGVKVVARTAKGETKTLEAEKLLVAIGRAPVTQGIGLEGTKVVVDRGYVKVDELMRTAEPSVYAIGDIIPTPMLAHVASAEGILAVDHIAGKPVIPINYDHVPNCTYCYPEVASVGLTEKKARERGYDVKVGTFPFPVNSKAAILGEREGLVKVVSDKKYDELLGIHIVGAQATNLIAEAGVALSLESTTEALAHVIHPHPTLSEAVVEAVHAALGHALHI